MAHASGYALHARTVFQGLRISIENRKGSWRVDKHHSPPKWRTKMLCDYGYIRGTEATDGDHCDVFVGPNPDAKYAFIVRQVNPRTGKFDEQKTMLGFDSMDEARWMYLKHYDSPAFFGGISAMPMSEFKRKVMGTLHGSKLIKGMVQGHYLTTHGGKKVWIAPYEDSRVSATRPTNEQSPRPSDSGLLFPEIGYVRPIKQKAPPKPAPPPIHQLSMFDMGTEKAVDEDGSKVFDSKPLTSQGAFEMSPLAQNMAHGFNELPGDEPVFFLSPGEGRAFKSAAFSLALAAGGDPATTLQKAKMRMLQAFALANLCFGGIIGDANREACLSAMGMEPVPFRFALRRLRDELRAPLHVEAATVPVQTACAEIPL